MLHSKAKNPAPSNLHFYYGILDTEKKNQDSLYSERDLSLLSNYNTLRNNTQSDAILMKPEYYCEMLAERFIRKNYLSTQERAQFRTFILDDVFFDDFNNRLNGEYIYGLLPDYRLYMAPIHEVRNHSYLIAGLPVIAIGHAYINNGYLMNISNNSGHYKPLLSEMAPGIEWFIKNISHDFLIEDHSTTSPEISHCGIKVYLASALCVMPLQALETAGVDLFLNHLCTVVLPQKSKETEEENEEENNEGSPLPLHSVISSHPLTGYQDTIPSNQNQSPINISVSANTENAHSIEDTEQPQEAEPSLIQRFTSIQRSIDYCRFNKRRREWQIT